MRAGEPWGPRETEGHTRARPEGFTGEEGKFQQEQQQRKRPTRPAQQGPLRKLSAHRAERLGPAGAGEGERGQGRGGQGLTQAQGGRDPLRAVCSGGHHTEALLPELGAQKLRCPLEST